MSNKDLAVSRSRAPETKSETITRWVIRILLFIWSVLIVFPLLWAVITSFKSQKDYMAGAFTWPTEFLIS